MRSAGNCATTRADLVQIPVLARTSIHIYSFLPIICPQFLQLMHTPQCSKSTFFTISPQLLSFLSGVRSMSETSTYWTARIERSGIWVDQTILHTRSQAYGNAQMVPLHSRPSHLRYYSCSMRCSIKFCILALSALLRDIALWHIVQPFLILVHRFILYGWTWYSFLFIFILGGTVLWQNLWICGENWNLDPRSFCRLLKTHPVRTFLNLRVFELLRIYSVQYLKCC